MKKGQVTIFIIVALLIVGLGSSYFIFKDDLKGQKKIPSEIVPIKNFVDSCIESEIEEAVYSIGAGGGYYFPPLLSMPGGFTYYFYEGKNYFPSKQKIEEQLENSIESKIFYCVGNFEDFSNYLIEKRAVEIKVKILDDRVVFDVKFPLKITIGEKTNVFENFGEFDFPVRLGLIHKSIDGLIKKGYYSSENVCLDCFAEMILENKFDIDFVDGGAGNSVFVITDYNEEIKKNFEYIFAV